MQPLSPAPHYAEPQRPPITTRFGMMGVGTPWGTEGFHGEDVLIWDGQAPPAPREYQPFSQFSSSDNHMPTPSSADFEPPLSYPASYSYVSAQFPNTEFTPITQPMQDLHLPPDQTQIELPSTNTFDFDSSAHTFDFDKMMADYINYQLPSAICQNCGLNGCSCRNCPAVMQTESGSWAQGCARKHVRYGSTATLEPASGGCCSRNVVAVPVPGPGGHDAGVEVEMNGSVHPRDQNGFGMMEMQTSDADPMLSQDFSVEDLKMMDTSEPMDINEFLLNDMSALEEPAAGCCCGGR